jgi:hypothetical protein
MQHPRSWAGGWLETGGIHQHNAWHIRALRSSDLSSDHPQRASFWIAYGLADGDCSYPFREGVLNRFWAWRSGMKTFSKVANQCHFVPFTENDS